jgi:hypothetical protein
MAKAKAPAKKKRAHNKDGSFKADDPATPNVNEAFVEEAAPFVEKVSVKEKISVEINSEPPARGYHPSSNAVPMNPGIQKKLAMEARFKK